MQYISNFKRRVGMICIMLLLIALPLYAEEVLEKGIYTVNNETHHDNPVGVGMSRSYTEPITTVEINGQGTFVQIGFNNTQFMGDFTVKSNGSAIGYEVVKEDKNNHTKELRFKVSSLTAPLSIGLYVEPMNVTVEYGVTFDISSLKLIKSLEVKEANPKEETLVKKEPTQEESAKVHTPQKVVDSAPSSLETVKVENSEKKLIGEDAKEGLQTDEVSKEVAEESTKEKSQEESQEELQEQEEVKENKDLKTQEVVRNNLQEEKLKDNISQNSNQLKQGSKATLVETIVLVGALGLVGYFRMRKGR